MELWNLTQSKCSKNVCEIEPNYKDHGFYNDTDNDEWGIETYPLQRPLGRLGVFLNK